MQNNIFIKNHKFVRFIISALLIACVLEFRLLGIFFLFCVFGCCLELLRAAIKIWKNEKWEKDLLTLTNRIIS